MKKIKPLIKSFKKELSLPGSLSYTIRALLLASLVKGEVSLINPLKSGDTYSLISCLKKLGIKINEEKNCFKVIGDIEDIKDKTYDLNINLSGRTARMLLGLLCIVPGTKILTCHADFKKRPIKDLVTALRKLGADITYLEKNGFLPLKIKSSQLNVSSLETKGDISSQYISSLLIIAPLIGGLKIKILGEQVSKPYININIDVMKKFGVNVLNKKYKEYIVKKGQSYKNPGKYYIEADTTAASYFFALAALTNSTIKIVNISPKSIQGDLAFVDILKNMGASVSKNEKENWIKIQGIDKLNAININMSDTPDIVQTLAIVAACANGKTYIKGTENLKFKETDRVKALKTELEKMKLKVTSNNNSITIMGGNPKGAEIETYNDHRMAMAFAILGTKIPGISIKNPDVVNKSYPLFWKDLERIVS